MIMDTGRAQDGHGSWSNSWVIDGYGTTGWTMGVFSRVGWWAGYPRISIDQRGGHFYCAVYSVGNTAQEKDQIRLRRAREGKRTKLGWFGAKEQRSSDGSIIK